MTALNDNVLVLNKHYCAVNIAPARVVFARLFNDHCRVLNELTPLTYQQWRELSYGYEGADVVRTPSYLMRVPSIVLLTRYDRLPNKEVRYTRHSIYERDGHRCQYCGKKFREIELNLDHVIPREAGGDSTWTNTVCSCVPCNSRKANRTPAQAGMRLLKEPRKPHWRPFVSVRLQSVVKPDWKQFLDTAGWQVEVSGHPVR